MENYFNKGIDGNKQELIEAICSQSEYLKWNLERHKCIQNERIEALKDLSRGFVHYINNMLTPIIGYSDFLIKNPSILEDKNRAMSFLKSIEDSSRDAIELLNSLREFYRQKENNEIYTRIDINKIIRQAVKLSQPRGEERKRRDNIEIDFELDLNDNPTINGNEIELCNVLTRLILYLVDSMTESGTLVLQTRVEEENVILEIDSNVCCINKNQKQYCFEPKFSNNSKKNGDFDLAIFYGAIKRHGGNIELKSEIGNVLAFRVSLKIMKEIQAEESIDSPKSLNALIINNEPVTQDILGKYLALDGHKFEIATSVNSGLSAFESNNFNLVIIDDTMDDMNIMDFTEIIKQKRMSIPIIMLMSFNSSLLSPNKKPENINYLLSKPIKLPEFRKTIEKLIQ